MTPFGGDVEIKNGANVQMDVVGYGVMDMGLSGNSTHVGIAGSTVEIQSGVSGIAPATSTVSIQDSTVAISGRAEFGAFTRLPSLDYSNGYVIYAGEDADSAVPVALEDLKVSAPYVRIESLPAAVEWGTDGESYPNAGTFTELFKALRASGTDTLYARVCQDVQLEGVNGPGAGKTLVLDLAGHTLTAKEGERVFVTSGNLVINDSSGDNSGKLTGGSAAHNSGGAVMIYGGGTLTLNGGTITGNRDSAVRVMRDATFYMNGGVITGNTADGYTPAGVDTALGKTILSGNVTITGNTNVDGESNLRVNTDGGETIAIGEAGLDAAARVGITCNSTDYTLGYTIFSDPFDAGKVSEENFISDSASHILKMIDNDGQKQLVRCYPQTASPTASLDAGTYSGARTVELTSTTAGAKIYYTTDGSDPMTSDTAQLYEGPITLRTTTTLRAYALQLGAIDASEVVTLEYTIRRSSGGSGTPSYRPTIEDTGHGTVTVSPSYAEQGEEVTITPKPDKGYRLDELLVTDQSGKQLELEDNGDGTYTFVQPKGKVAIEATFTEAVCDGGKGCPSTAYRDVPVSAWYHAAVDYAIENELMKGYSTSAFGPNDTLTRAMMVQILWNLEGQPVVNYAMQYTDVDTDAWYAEAVRWASAEQIVTGYSEAQFGPEDSITREQMAAVLYRYAQYQDYDTPQSGMAIREYSDYDSISPWALNAMDWAVNAELIDGRGHNLLVPNGTATRAEVAQIFMNFCEKIFK